MSDMEQPCAWGGPAGRGRMRTAMTDFRVDEVLGFEPDGTGEHAWLWIRKQGANTEDVAQALARFAGVRRGAIGYSGLKDRNADTGQWFSIHLPGREEPDWAGFDCDQWQIGRALRHGRKLRRGTHRANRFRLVIRDIEAEAGEMELRLEAVARGGFPNYFGPQRFGRGGENLDKARRALAGQSRAGRRLRGLYLSAARARLFNRVLAQRVSDGTWCTPLTGDAIMLAGTHSIFRCTGTEPDLPARIAAFDIDVTGPLWGSGERLTGETIARNERRWIAPDIDLAEGLEAIGMRASRRPLRAPAQALEWSFANDCLELSFDLPQGAYATSLVREIVAT